MDFSIIIPAKNETSNIGNCLDSINSVRFPRARFEILVVDNGSTDRTVDIAKEKGAKVFIKPDVTISALRNFGASQAQGDILVFLDADCTVQEDWLEEAARYLADDTVVCFGGPPGIPDEATWVQSAWFQVRGRQAFVEDVEWLESMNMFVRGDRFLQVQGFNETLVTCEDYDLSLRLKKTGRIVADQRIKAVHHGEAATITHFFKKELWRGTSSIQGILSHGFTLRELPSILVPLFYLFFALVTVGIIIYSTLFSSPIHILVIVGLVMVWQVPFLLLAVLKVRSASKIPLVGQLFVLLNVYFLARGTAMLRRG